MNWRDWQYRANGIASPSDVRASNTAHDYANMGAVTLKDVGATYGQQTGQWLSKINPEIGNNTTNYWAKQMSPEYANLRDNDRWYRFITDAIDPVNMIGLGEFSALPKLAAMGKRAELTDTLFNIGSLTNDMDVTDLRQMKPLVDVASEALTKSKGVSLKKSRKTKHPVTENLPHYGELWGIPVPR